MGRFIVTNNTAWYNQLDNIYSNQIGLKKKGEVKNEDFSSCYMKKYVSNENFYAVGQNYVMVNGTLIYDGSVQSEAMKNLFEDYIELCEKYSSEDIVIKHIREKCVGMYGIIINVNGKKICFVDGTSMYAVHYYFDENQYLITNTYYNTNECVYRSGIPDVVLENGLCATVVGNDTVFDNIKRLLENEYILIGGGDFMYVN